MKNKPSDWVTADEAKALADIRDKCGRQFPRLQSITVSSAKEADLLFPVLAEWAQKGSPPIRAAALTCFDNVFAKPYLPFLLERWQLEPTGEIISEMLAQILAKLVDNKHALQAWQIARNKVDPGVCRLLVRLYKLKATKVIALEAILAEFSEGRLPYYRLVVYSRIRNERVAAFYSTYLQDSDRHVRALAQRVQSKQRLATKGLEMSSSPPPRGRPHEAFSVEIDLERMEHVLEDISEQFRISLPSSAMETLSAGSLARERLLVHTSVT